MFSFDPLWVYVAVPAALVSILILIKLRQKETDKIPVARELSGEAKQLVEIRESEIKRESLTEVKGDTAKSETSEKNKPHGCNNYMGYLYMKKAPNEMHIPTGCYNCLNLLKCLYSPVVVEKVYGE